MIHHGWTADRILRERTLMLESHVNRNTPLITRTVRCVSDILESSGGS
jgi:hypothetical protein